MRLHIDTIRILKQLSLRAPLRQHEFIFPYKVGRYTVYCFMRQLIDLGYVKRQTTQFDERKVHYYLTDDGYDILNQILEELNANTPSRRALTQSNPQPFPVRCEFPAPIPPHRLDAKDPRASAGVYEQEIKGDRS